MKYRNKKTGEVYNYIVDVLDDFCDRKCADCKIKCLSNEYKLSFNQCETYCIKNPRDAAHLMGYEVIEDSEPEQHPTRADILHEAERCVGGQREQDYGKPENNFETIGLLWGVYLRAAHPELAKVMGMNHINAKDVAVMMALLKVARIAKGNGKVDRFVDCCGYIACCGENAWSKKRE